MRNSNKGRSSSVNSNYPMQQNINLSMNEMSNYDTNSHINNFLPNVINNNNNNSNNYNGQNLKELFNDQINYKIQNPNNNNISSS